MATSARANGDPIVIKKYANRRLYDTARSTYITLDTLAQMTRDDVDFTVVDARSGEDITHNVLTQIVVEGEAGEDRLLPIAFLRQLITLYGQSARAIMPGYLEEAVRDFRANQKKWQQGLEDTLSQTRVGALAVEGRKQLQETLESAWRANPLSQVVDRALGAARPSPAEERAQLRRQIDELQRRLDALEE